MEKADRRRALPFLLILSVSKHASTTHLVSVFSAWCFGKRMVHLRPLQERGILKILMTLNSIAIGKPGPGLQLRLHQKYMINVVQDSVQIIIAIVKIAIDLQPLRAILNMHACYDYIRRHLLTETSKCGHGCVTHFKVE